MHLFYLEYFTFMILLSMSVPEALDTFLSHLQIVEAEDADDVEGDGNK